MSDDLMKQVAAAEAIAASNWNTVRWMRHRFSTRSHA
jgi:hypothetical protein